MKTSDVRKYTRRVLSSMESVLKTTGAGVGIEELARAGEGSLGEGVEASEIATEVTWLVLSHLGGAGPRLAQKVAERIQLLRVLTNRRHTLDARRERALTKVLVDQLPSLVGFSDLLAEPRAPRACGFLLHLDEVWWKERGHATWVDAKAAHEASPEAPPEGRVAIPRRRYLELARADIVEELAETTGHGPLEFAVRVALGYTEGRFEYACEGGFGALGRVYGSDQEVRTAIRNIKSRFRAAEREGFVAIPHHPIATLPREAMLLAEIGTCRSEWAKIRAEPTGQLELLSYDRKLVLKGEDRLPDTYIKIPLNALEMESFERERAEWSGGDLSPRDIEVGLAQQLVGEMIEHPLVASGKRPRRYSKHKLMRDVPRVVAGMFRAAEQDGLLGERLDAVKEGEFMDSENAHRLTGLIGMEQTMHHKERVAHVRAVLQRVWLTRQLIRPSPQGAGRTESFEHSAPIVQRLQDTFKRTDCLEEQGGLRRVRESTIYLWRINSHMWKLRKPDSGVSRFMAIDERAFGLDGEDSGPFNLYWTIVQRAYHCGSKGQDVIAPDGSFAVSVEALCYWSGMLTASSRANPSRLASDLRHHLALMVDRGLLLDFSCDALGGQRVSIQALLKSSVRVTLPGQLIGYLPQRAVSRELES